MKILYLGNFENPFSDSTEKHIKFALEQLGHEVIVFDEKEFDAGKIASTKGDLFLFHKGGASTGVPVPVFIELLNKLTCKKVCWYFDKLYQGREAWADMVVPYIDYFFTSDETWVRRHTYKNVRVLRQGIGNEDMSLGKETPGLGADVVFLGSVYGDRTRFVKDLQENLGDQFKIENSSFGRKLYDLCASTKIFVAPKYPQDDYYWSNRVYMILGSGGFLIHPKLEGLKAEFKDGEHLVMYKDENDMYQKIAYYLKNDEERKRIQMAGYKHVTENITYLHRVKTLLDETSK